MAKKYQLPKVAQLDDLDFQFEHGTIQLTFKHIKQFVKNNEQSLIDLFLPGLDPEEYDRRKKMNNCNNDLMVLEIIRAKLRIGGGKIQRRDWLFKVPSFHKDNKQVLMNAYQNQIEKYMVDTKLAFYDWTYLGIKQKNAFRKVLYNELLRLIILNLPQKPLGDIKRDKKQKKIKRLNESKVKLLLKAEALRQKSNSLLSRGCYADIARLDDQIQEIIFSKGLNVRQKAGRSLYKIDNHSPDSRNPRYTSIKEKENILHQYLKLQTHRVRAAKNTRGKGINAGKKQKVLTYKTKNPKASISKIASICNVDRKTVRKYLNE